MSDVPLAAYEDPRWMPTEETPVGNRGYTGNPATLQTNLTTNTNNDLVISAKDCFGPNDPPIKIQYAVLANGAPAWLYEDGYPAMWTLLPGTDLGFTILMKRAGAWGNNVTLTLVNPGRLSSLSIRRPAMNNIVVTLANSGSAVTTTPALLCAAINSHPELPEYMIAFPSSAIVAVLPAVAQKAFTGGMDVPGLELVSLGSSTGGVVSTTANTVRGMLSGSRYVTAVNATTPANDGTGLAEVLTATALTGGTPNRGEVADQFLARRSAWAKRRRAGEPLGKENNKTLQLRSTRFGAMRNYQRVPSQDRAIATSRFQNYATDTLAAHMLG